MAKKRLVATKGEFHYFIEDTPFGIVCYSETEDLQFTGESSANGLRRVKRKLREYLGKGLRWKVEDAP